MWQYTFTSPAFVNCRERDLAVGVAPEIERAGRRQREHVVKERIAVRKIDDRSARDGDDARHERLVFLTDLTVHRRKNAGICRAFQVEHDVAQFGLVA
jgi:hypothetical protein